MKKLKRIRSLMLLSQLLLLAFMGYWLYTQYKSERTGFQKEVIAQFDESQRKISDSLLGFLMQSPIPVRFKAKEVQWTDTSPGPGGGKQMIRLQLDEHSPRSSVDVKEINTNGLPGDSSFVLDAEKTITYNQSRGTKPGLNVSLIIKRLKTYTDSNQDYLFRRDTVLFNKEFTEKMKENGWGFKVKWTKDSASSLKNKKSIYIKSEYFTDSYGLEVSHFSWYLFKRISPQVLFTLVLLVITGFASRLAYISLKEQIALGTIKNEFISNMSHELKTPVSTIKVALEALDTYNVIDDKKTAKEYLEMANTEVKRLDLLINQALNTALLEDGRMALHKENEDLQKLSAEVLDVLKLRFAQQHAHVSLSHEGNNFLSPVDKLHIQGVVINILDNSLKYGGKDPAIEVKISEEAKTIRISIADKGPGIPAAYLDKVFDKFFRVPTGDEHSVKGYGLGLSYARQVMQQHGGSIAAANKPGGGAVFTLTFIKSLA